MPGLLNYIAQGMLSYFAKLKSFSSFKKQGWDFRNNNNRTYLSSYEH